MAELMAETVDQTIVALAARRDGVCERDDLIAAGVSSAAINRRLAAGGLHLPSQGVYVVPPLATKRTPLVAALAAVPRSAAGFASAGRIYGFALSVDSHHIVVPKSTTNRVKGVRVHETRLWYEDDIADVGSLRVTTPERTICDLSSDTSVSSGFLRHLTETQLVARRVDVGELVACHQRLARRGRRGSRRLALLLGELIDDEPMPESELEVRVAEAFEKRGCRVLQRQFQPPWFDGLRGIVDFAEPVGKTIVEADGRRWHSTTQAMAEDRRRDRAAVAHGWIVIRLGWRELSHGPSVDEAVQLINDRLAATTAQ